MKGEADVLTIERFSELLDAFGASPARWPAASRAGAEILLARSDLARRSLAEARALDAMLDAMPPPATSDQLERLAGRIVAAAGAAAPRLPASSPGARVVRLPLPPARPRPASEAAAVAGRRWRFGGVGAMGALAASLLFGIAIGLTDLAPSYSLLGFGTSQDTALNDSEVVLSSLQTDGIDEEQL